MLAAPPAGAGGVSIGSPRVFRAGPDEVYLHPLVPGVQVLAGTVLGHLGAAGEGEGAQAPASAPGQPALAGAAEPHMLFQIRPAGAGAPLIDPKPILDGWVRLEETSVFRAKGENPFLATSPTVGQVLLASKPQLEQLLLRDPGVHLPRCERGAVRAGEVDRRVLAALEFLSVSGLSPTVSAAGCAHGASSAGVGNAIGAAAGDAVDISGVDGTPVAGHEGPDSVTDIAVRRLLRLQGTMKPAQIVSAEQLPGHRQHADAARLPRPDPRRLRGRAGLRSRGLLPHRRPRGRSAPGRHPRLAADSQPVAATGLPARRDPRAGRDGQTLRGRDPQIGAVAEDGHDHATSAGRWGPRAASAAERPSGPPRPVSPPPRSVGRWVAAGALALVVGVLAYIVFSGGGGANYKFELENASQIVLGDQVQVGGVPVGSVTGITLTHNYKALVTIHVEGSLVPLHEGTTAQIRVPSLTTVAGRYVALSPGPNNRPALPAGATLPPGSAQGTTDLDQLFDTLNPRTRKGLQELFVGTAEQYAGATLAAGLSAEYFSPVLSSANHIFTELTRDQHTFTEFLVQSAKALATLGAHHEALTEFVDQRQPGQPGARRRTGEPPARGGGAARHAAGGQPRVRAAALDVRGAAPPGERRRTRHQAARALLQAAGAAGGRSGAGAARPQPRDQPPGAEQRPHRRRARAAHAREDSPSGSPNAVKALQESVPVTALCGPYAPDLEGAVRDFGTSAGYYDGNGNYARVAPVFDNFTLGAGNTLTPVTPPQGLQGLHTHELLRCPGAGATPPPADGSAPFTDNGQLGCDPTQVP